jgi:SAM-dependent methyltransferase
VADQDACPCCGERRAVHLFRVAGYEYVRCTSCDAARLDPLPPADPVELYDETYFVGAAHGGYMDYEADALLHRRNAVARLDRLVPWLPARQPLHLVDVGCASGYVLDEAVHRGWKARGVDASPFARSRAAARGHHVDATISAALDESAAAGEQPDVVAFFQVLEHMLDAYDAIESAAGALTSGGVLAVETWDRLSRVARAFGPKWQQANPPSVIHLFNRAGLTQMVERSGLRVVSMTSTSKLVSAGLIAGVAAHRYGVLGRAAQSVARTTRLTKVAIPYRLGDVITLVAIKP